MDTNDLSAITAAMGQMAASLNTDVDGNGVVNSLDRLYTSRNLGHHLSTGLHLDA